MASGRTRNRHPSRNSSSDASPSNSSNSEEAGEEAPQKTPTKLRSRSGSSSGTPELDVEEADVLTLWTAEELGALAKEIVKRDSVDAAKLFVVEKPGDGSGDDTVTLLPPQMKALTHDDVKALLDRFKTQLMAEVVASWAPGCSVAAILGMVMSEHVLIRAQETRFEEDLMAYRKQKGEFDAIKRYIDLATAMSMRASVQIDVEVGRRKSAESIKAVGEENLSSIRRDITAVCDAKDSLESELNTWRLNELDTRRRLDRIRLKIAATRGEMVTATVDVLKRPPPRWMIETNVCESVTSAESNDDDGKVGDEDAGSPHSSQEADTAVQDNDGDVEMQVVESKVNEEAATEVQTRETQGEDDEEEELSSDIDDIGFDEDAVATEIRLLKNRLDMYDNEAQEWQSSLQAIRVQSTYVEKAIAMLELEAARISKHSLTGSSKLLAGGNERRVSGASASKAARARRVSQIQQLEPPPVAKVSRKTRKGTPKRGLSMGERTVA